MSCSQDLNPGLVSNTTFTPKCPHLWIYSLSREKELIRHSAQLPCAASVLQELPVHLRDSTSLRQPLTLLGSPTTPYGISWRWNPMTLIHFPLWIWVIISRLSPFCPLQVLFKTSISNTSLHSWSFPWVDVLIVTVNVTGFGITQEIHL